jgi:hypothetical protein
VVLAQVGEASKYLLSHESFLGLECEWFVPLCGNGLRGNLAKFTATLKLGGGVLFGGFCWCSENIGSNTCVLLTMLIVIIGMLRNFFLR